MPMKLVNLLLTLLCVLGRLCTASDFPEVPKLALPSSMDGSLNDPAWKNAALFKLEKAPVFAKLKPKPVEACSVRVFTDDANIYFGFHCISTAAPFVAEKQHVRFGTPGELVMASDYVCALIDPGHFGFYNHYLVYIDSTGRLYFTTSYFLQAACQEDLDSTTYGLEAAAAKASDGKAWTATLKVPFAALLRHPKDGMIKRIGLNFRRVQWGEDGPLVKHEQCWTRAVDRGTGRPHFLHMSLAFILKRIFLFIPGTNLKSILFWKC
jgi:hypothetical protein